MFCWRKQFWQKPLKMKFVDSNPAAFVLFSFRYDLDYIAYSARNCKNDSQKFTITIINNIGPKATFLIFKQGKMNIFWTKMQNGAYLITQRIGQSLWN